MKRLIMFFLILSALSACSKPTLEVPKTELTPILSSKEEKELAKAVEEGKRQRTSLEELEGLQKLTPQDITPDMIAKAQHSLNDVGQEKGVLSKMIHFDFDSYELTAEAKKILEEIADYLKEYKKIKIVIEGHCDERGTREYNLVLGMKRAEVAKKYLVDLGIEENRIEIISYGKDKPLIAESNEEAWRINRRDQFKRIQ